MADYRRPWDLLKLLALNEDGSIGQTMPAAFDLSSRAFIARRAALAPSLHLNTPSAIGAGFYRESEDVWNLRRLHALSSGPTSAPMATGGTPYPS